MKFTLSSLLFLLVITIAGCEKEANRKLLDANFSYTANGKSIVIKEGVLLNENLFRCSITGDTALQIIVSKVYDGAGFFISDSAGIKSGTYILDEKNKAFFNSPTEYKKYYTTRKAVGTITIKRGTFQGKSLLETLEGTFSFNATDTVTNKTIAITEGSFLMEVRD